MKNSETWLENNLNYDEIKNTLQKSIDFYGSKIANELVKTDCELELNAERRRNKLGDFSPFRIRLFSLKSTMSENNTDVVFVHELAHFLDSYKRNKYSRYKFASSRRGTNERIIAELFRNNMDPVPEKRTNYRGRTCELFARAIEEYYAIVTDNKSSLTVISGWDYYVDVDKYKKNIFPLVKRYFEELNK